MCCVVSVSWSGQPIRNIQMSRSNAETEHWKQSNYQFKYKWINRIFESYFFCLFVGYPINRIANAHAIGFKYKKIVLKHQRWLKHLKYVWLHTPTYSLVNSGAILPIHCINSLFVLSSSIKKKDKMQNGFIR